MMQTKRDRRNELIRHLMVAFALCCAVVAVVVVASSGGRQW